jgi:phage terminase large subunit-like protein
VSAAPIDVGPLRAFLASPVASWRPWTTPEGDSPQADFLRAAGTHRVVVFRSGNQIGKTEVGAASLALMLLGHHPHATVPRRGLRAWCSALSWDTLARTLWPKIQPLLPDGCQVVWRQKSHNLPHSVSYPPTGNKVFFVSAEQTPDKMSGATLHAAWLDEPHPAPHLREVRTRLLRHSGLLLLTLTPVRRRGWVEDLEREETTKVIRASLYDAARAGLHDLAEVERYAAALPEHERKVRVFGDLAQAEGAVWPDFSRRRHCVRVRDGALVNGEGDRVAPWPLPESWPRYASVDFGYRNPTALLVGAVDPFTGRLIVEACYYASGIRAARWAELIQRELPRLTRPIVADHDLQARAELEAQGVPTLPAVKSVDAGLETVARALAADRVALVIRDEQRSAVTGRCDAERVAAEVEAYHYPEQREGRPSVRDAPVKVHDHTCDALRYLLVELERSQGGPPTPPQAKPGGRWLLPGSDDEDDEYTDPRSWGRVGGGR